MSLDTPTLSELTAAAQADINGRLDGADSRLRRSWLGVLARVFAGLVKGLYGLISALMKEMLPDTATATGWLPRHGAIRGVPQKAATFASGPVDLDGSDDAVVAAGEILQALNGVQYRVMADVIFDGDSATAQVEAVVAGAAGNAIAGVQLSFVSPVAGVSSAAVVATGGIAGGNDAEDPEAWRARILDRIRKPPQGGSRADYEQWVKSVPGVTRVWVYPRWAGAGTVGLAFVYDGREDVVPSSDERAAMLAWLADLCPVHLADYGLYVIALTAAPDSFSIRLTPNTEQTRQATANALIDLYSREARPGGTMLLTHIEEAIALARGVTDFDLLLPTDDIDHDPTDMPAVGDIDWGM